ncbi:hypothetical protein IC582_027594 [Cucumis melo]|uniref:Protein PSY1-like n=1 Tax=Cucumis melo TaxID=3656 RepID=A0A1S3C5B4_CUCME|nr:protein PSY1-like [Cucumis melo]
MASSSSPRLSFYFSFLLLLLLTTAMVASAARHAPPIPISSNERNDEGMIGLQDYGDARANHRHDPHHPLTVNKGNKKELDG